jgi:hypothetical protein
VGLFGGYFTVIWWVFYRYLVGILPYLVGKFLDCTHQKGLQ